MKKLFPIYVFLFVIVIFLLSLSGCGNSYQHTYGVACNQYGHLSTIKINSQGAVTYSGDYPDMNPPAQTCQVQPDGSIIVRNIEMK